MKDIVIIGAGGFAREVNWLIEEINSVNEEWNLLGYIYENPDNIGQLVNDKPVLGDFDWLKDKRNVYFVCAIGDPNLKKRLVDKCLKYDVKAATLIHPDVKISRYTNIEEGTIVCKDSILTVNIHIGKHVIINLDCTIGHDAIIGAYSTILPSVNVSGNVVIGEQSMLGTSSAVIEKLSIGRNTIVGAGAVVVTNLPENCTAVGVPAKVIKQNN